MCRNQFPFQENRSHADTGESKRQECSLVTNPQPLCSRVSVRFGRIGEFELSLQTVKAQCSLEAMIKRFFTAMVLAIAIISHSIGGEPFTSNSTGYDWKSASDSYRHSYCDMI